MATIITYDLVNKHTEVKHAMFTLGYSDGFTNEGRKVQLPNTTLYHTTKSPATAREDLKATCARLSSTLERCFATSVSSDWASWS